MKKPQTRRPWRAALASLPSAKPLVGVVMGSNSDWKVMQHAVDVLKDFGVPYETKVVSAHRTPDTLYKYAETAGPRGLRCIIAGAGGAAHLPGMLAAKTTLPVLGVPVTTRALHGIDSLLSIVQMPKGVPVATFAIGEAGAANAALFAVAMLANHDPKLARKLTQFRKQQVAKVKAMKLPPHRDVQVPRKGPSRRPASRDTRASLRSAGSRKRPK